jgi:hypothetical protein
MSRNLDSTLEAAISQQLIYPVRLAQLTFASETMYIWSGPGTLVWDSLTFTGVGSLGSVGTISESVDINAQGTSVTLSGIDPLLLAESLTDIQLGAIANIWFGLVTPQRVLIGTPYLQFSGIVDTPSVTPGMDTISITLNLENRLIDHARPSMRRYDSADQRLYYPTDSAFGWVEQLNDLALGWGSS